MAGRRTASRLLLGAVLGVMVSTASAQTPAPSAAPPEAKPSTAATKTAPPGPAASPLAQKPGAISKPSNNAVNAKTASPPASAPTPVPVTPAQQPIIVNITQPATVKEEAPSNNWGPGLVGLALLGTLGFFGIRYAKQRGMTVAGTLQQIGVEMPQDGANGAGQVQPLRPAAPPAPPLPSLAELPVATSAPATAAAFTTAPAVMSGPPRLVGLAGGVEGESFEIAQGLSVGRDGENDIPLAQDTTVSRRHARIEPSPSGGFQVSDNGSSNGTFVNGARVSGVRLLQPGDQIQIGATRLRFEA